MVHNLEHDLLARRDHDDLSRQRFILAMKRHLTGKIRPGNEAIYEHRAKHVFEAAKGREPKTRDEVLSALLDTDLYQSWAALHICSQEMMWQTVSECINRDEDRMRATARALITANDRKGSLELDSDFHVPTDVTIADVHLQPLGYAHNNDDEDIRAGALYEMGGNIYSQGRGMGGDDSKAGAVHRYLSKTFPDFAPERILDMGCSAGASSVPYTQFYPEAEVHAIDAGAAMLRYAHARAEALGAPVHFHQMSAAATGFEDGSFDLVVSHNIMHEISDDVRKNMMKETFRLLRPGGIGIHQDVEIKHEGKTLFQIGERAWDRDFNGEPFWEVYAAADEVSEAIDAGFSAEQVYTSHLEKVNGPGTWYAVIMVKS